MRAKINGIELFYHDQGPKNGMPLLLIHGFPLDSEMWQAQLSANLPGMRLIVPDLRGFGQSTAVDGPGSIDTYAGDMIALLDHVGIKRAAVVGLSMGGYVAFALWRKDPDRVRALVLLDTRAEADSAEAKTNRNKMMEIARRDGAEAIADELMPKLLSPANLKRREIVDPLRQIIVRQSVEAIVAALHAMRDRSDSSGILNAIGVPAMVLVGEEDQMTPPSVARTIVEGMVNASMLVVPRAGHMSNIENPDSVNDAVVDFLSQLSPDYA